MRFWLTAALVVGILSCLTGGAPLAVLSATALAAAPALFGLWLGHRLSESLAVAALTTAWLIAGVGLAAGTGGAASPLAAVLLVAPALGRVLGIEAGLELAAAAALADGAAEVLAQAIGRAETVGPFAPLLAGAALLMTGALFAAAPRAAPMSRRLAEVSHDLRTPLTHILGFAEMIEHRIFGPIEPRYVEYAGLIRTSGAHLLQMVNDVLDLSRLDAGRYVIEFETFDVRALATEAARMASDLAGGKGVTVSARTPDAPVMVRADPQALRRMLTNTVGNAVKFTPSGGRVTVEVRASGPMLLLDTIDTGPGIPETERGRLGHAFERGGSGAGAEGAGLGLALVRALAEMHGGALTFHDAPGGGALVRIEAPVVVA